jgi:hypothetical protein
MKKTINIGTEIDLEDLIKSRMLIQANSGGGKSGIARVIMEECYGKLPFIIMDIEGEYYTLKEQFGDIIVIGGDHGDAPISLQMAPKLPKFIIENGLSVVLDVQDLEMTQRIRFAKMFLEALMALPQQYWVSYLIFLEECHKLAGEQDKFESGPAVKDLMSRGRKRGYCGIPITQRISKLHKDVAAECNNKFIGRTFLDIDMDRSAKELGFSKPSDRLKLRDLKTRQFYAFGTSIEPHEVHLITVNEAKTKMVQAGSSMAIKTKPLTGKVISILGKLNEEISKKEPPKQPKLQVNLPVPANANQFSKIEEMNRQLQIRNSELINQVKERDLQVSGLKKAILVYEKKQTDIASQLCKISERLTYSHGVKLEEISKNRTLISENGTDVQEKRTNVSDNGQNVPRSVQNVSPKREILSTEVARLPPGERAVLIACAQFGHGLERNQLTVITGYKRSSRDAYIARLKEKGLLRRDTEKVTVSQDGIDLLGNDFEPLPTGEDLQQYWLNKLPPGERAVLEILIKHYPEGVSRDDISEATGYMRSSRDAYIARMSAKELIEVTGPGSLRASCNLFNE